MTPMISTAQEVSVETTTPALRVHILKINRDIILSLRRIMSYFTGLTSIQMMTMTSMNQEVSVEAGLDIATKPATAPHHLRIQKICRRSY